MTPLHTLLNPPWKAILNIVFFASLRKYVFFNLQIYYRKNQCLLSGTMHDISNQTAFSTTLIGHNQLQCEGHFRILGVWGNCT
jgi:hypothetical protein